MADLSLVPTDDLLMELFNRFQDAVFVGGNPHGEFKGRAGGVAVKYHGTPWAAVGLCQTAQHVINNLGQDQDSLDEG